MIALVKNIYDSLLDRELSLNAASLSFYTIFTIVPLLLVLLGIVSYFDIYTELYKNLQEIILKNFLPVNHELIISYLDKFLEQSIKMSIFSFLVLFISSLLFFQNYEYIVNIIFEAQQRNIFQSLGVYLFIIFLTPISLGFTFYISLYLANIIESQTFTSGLNIFRFVPFLIIWILFFILYKLSANTFVSFKASILSSFVIAVVFSIAKELFIYYVFFNNSYDTLYGSFSILMFLFLWIYISWFIFLQGLSLCSYINKTDIR